MNDPKETNERRVSAVTVILAVLLAFAIGVIIWLLVQYPKQQPSGADPESVPAAEEPVEKLTDTIEVPGYGALTLKAGVTGQDIAIPNPPQNFCFFRVSLALEDGTVLWTSDIYGPGEDSGKIVLSSPLEKGKYDEAELRFECFADSEGTQSLNGANTRLTLNAE